jgi:hypothetical protein
MLFYHLLSSENCKVRPFMSTEFCNEYHKFHLQMINIHAFDKHFESVKFTSYRTMPVFISKVLYFRDILNYVNSRNSNIAASDKYERTHRRCKSRYIVNVCILNKFINLLYYLSSKLNIQ